MFPSRHDDRLRITSANNLIVYITVSYFREEIPHGIQVDILEILENNDYGGLLNEILVAKRKG